MKTVVSKTTSQKHVIECWSFRIINYFWRTRILCSCYPKTPRVGERTCTDPSSSEIYRRGRPWVRLLRKWFTFTTSKNRLPSLISPSQLRTPVEVSKRIHTVFSIVIGSVQYTGSNFGYGCVFIPLPPLLYLLILEC